MKILIPWNKVSEQGRKGSDSSTAKSIGKLSNMFLIQASQAECFRIS